MTRLVVDLIAASSVWLLLFELRVVVGFGRDVDLAVGA